MRLRRKSLWAKIDSGGDLQCYWGELEAFCKLHPNRNVLIRVEIQPIEPSENLTNYWFGYAVKKIKRAFYESGESLTDAQTFDKIRENCPVFLEQKRENGSWKTRAKEWEELDSAEAVEAVSWLQEWAAENFQCIIDDPD